MDKLQAMQPVTETLTKRGVHHIHSGFVEVVGRCCIAYLPLGVLSVVDVQSLSVHRDLRDQGYGRAFMASLISAAEHEEHDGIRFLNVISPAFEGFLIRLGFRLTANSDYILLRNDFTSAKERTLTTGKPVF